MKADDIRLSTYDLRADVQDRPRWRRGRGPARSPRSSPPRSRRPRCRTAPSIRAIVLNPSRYLDQKVTITGQFSGRNLLGDLPDAPGEEPLRLRPALGRRRHLGHQHAAEAKDARQGLRARPRRAHRHRPLADGPRHGAAGRAACSGSTPKPAASRSPSRRPRRTTEEEPIRVPAGPPPEVVFSAPTQDETDVSQGTTRADSVLARHRSGDAEGTHRARTISSRRRAERGEPVTPSAEFTFQYTGANRVLELKFAKPLERFRTLKVDLLDGILGTDGQPLKPWTLTFSARRQLSRTYKSEFADCEQCLRSVGALTAAPNRYGTTRNADHPILRHCPSRHLDRRSPPAPAARARAAPSAIATHRHRRAPPR